MCLDHTSAPAPLAIGWERIVGHAKVRFLVEEKFLYNIYTRSIVEDIDECATQNLCNGHHEICTNIRGGYRCKQIECPYGYILDPDKKKYVMSKSKEYWE
jgi:Calcium-binding EGF domain